MKKTKYETGIIRANLKFFEKSVCKKLTLTFQGQFLR